MSAEKIAKRAMKLKILYTFDEQHSTTCLARTAANYNVSVVYGDENNAALGVVDLSACLEAVQQSSPELVAHNALDYAVYSTDLTEPDSPFVGHGRMSWLMLSAEPVQVVGRVCNNILPFAAAKEILQVQLRLTPIHSNYQRDYLTTLQLYTVVAPQLPKDFNHPLWSQFVTRTDLVRLLGSVEDGHNHYNYRNSSSPPPAEQQPSQNSLKHQLIQATSPVDELRPPSPKRIKSVSSSDPSKIQYPASSPPMMKCDEPNPRQCDLPNDWKTVERSRSISAHDFSSPMMKTTQSVQPLNTTQNMQPLSTNQSVEPLQTLYKPSVRLLQPTPRPPLRPQPQQQKAKARSKKQKEKIAQSLMEAVQNGDVPDYCENCGDIKTTTWRNLKHNGKAIKLCNACGLYLSTKKVMRPAELWSGARPKKSAGKVSKQPAEPGDKTSGENDKTAGYNKDSATSTPQPSSSEPAPARKTQSEQPVSSSPPKATSHSKPSDTIVDMTDEDNKENCPPSNDLVPTSTAFTQSPRASDLESLFSTPVKSKYNHSEATMMGSSSAVKWLAKAIGKNDEADMFQSFLASPSRKNGIAHSDLYDTLVRDLQFDSMDQPLSDSSAVPSSPPPFFYLYDEPSHWSKWSTGPDTVRSETIREDQPDEAVDHASAHSA